MKSAPTPTIFAIDDDPDELLLIRSRCESIGMPVKTYGSPMMFLDEVTPETLGCVVTDLIMAPMTGLQLHAEMGRRDLNLPIIVMTGHADAATCRAAFREGVFDFVEKGFGPHELVQVIQQAMEKNRRDSAQRQRCQSHQEKIATLSPREREVMDELTQGKTLKEIAAAFQISVQTASKHRGNLFSKLEVANEVELLKQWLASQSDRFDGVALSAN